MKELNMHEYEAQKASFYKKHYGENGFKERSTLEGETIRKAVYFDDGATWYEVSRPETVQIEQTIHGVKVIVPVTLYTTEVWDTDNSVSRKLWQAA